MYAARVQSGPATMPVRFWTFAIVVTLMALTIAPAHSVQAQTESSSGALDIASVVPDTSLFYAYANLDFESSQALLAAELLERSGLTETFGGEMMIDDPAADIPEGAEVAVVVTSIPETSDVSVADVSLDPLAATQDLEDGGYALIISSNNVQETYEELLASIDMNVESSGGDVTMTDYSGVTITSYLPEAGDDFTEPSAVALVGDYAIQAGYLEDIQPIIDTAAGTLPALNTNENFLSLAGMLPTEHLALGFINGPAAVEALELSSPEVIQNFDQRSFDVLDAWTAFSFSAEQAGFRLETRSIANATPFEEITSLDGSFLDRVDSDALLVINGSNIDATGLVSTFALLLAGGIAGEDPLATPVGGATPTSQEDYFASAESLLGFNLKTDFVDQLVGEFGLAVSLEGDVMDTSVPPAVDAIMFSELDNPVPVQDALSKISFIIGAGMGDAGAIETRDVNGSQVSVVDIADTGVADRAEFGVVDGELVISVGNGLENYLGIVESPLSQDANFTAVMDQLPTGYGGVAYINLSGVLTLTSNLTNLVGEGLIDADDSCAEYATQAEAQAAYDEDQFENFQLDQDFDGEACEDFFNPVAATPEATGNPYPNIVGLASVSTQEDGVNGTTTFLLIGGE